MAETAVEKSKISSKKTDIELAILSAMTEKDRELTIETIMEEIEKNGIANQGDTNPENGQVKTQPDGYVYEIKTDSSGDWVVTYKGKGEVEISELLISLRKSTEVITNQVVITMVAKSNDGIASYTEPKGTTPTKTYPSGTNEITETYTVTDNGVYTFTVQNNNGTTETKSMTINNILNGTIPMELSTSLPTNQNVIVTITWPSGSEKAVKEVKVGDGSWQTEIGSITKVEVAQNCTVVARVRNSSTDITNNNITITNIDKTNPTVTASEESEIINKGYSNEIRNYFTVIANGTAEIASIKYVDTSNENVEVTNTNTLAVGTHIIKCIVTKETGASASATKTIIVEIFKDGSWTGEVNSPMLMEGMTAVYWSTDGGATASTTQEGASPIYSKVGGKSTGANNSAFKWENWYAYVAGDNSTDTKTSRWANAVTDDGSYWVWIPRFKYKISEQPTSAGITNAGKIEVQFIPTTEKTGTSGYTTAANSEGEILTTDGSGYIIHPVFENGSSNGKNNGYANGEWDSELPGFWVAKYEMSMEDGSGNAVTTDSASVGNVAISSSVKMVSKPGVTSWRYIQIGQTYQNCIKYDTSKNSHMIKNSEWGAVAYLTHSQYGRNRNEVTINNNKNYITGIAGDSVVASKSESTTNAYNTTKGMLASTTGNIYGVNGKIICRKMAKKNVVFPTYFLCHESMI